MAKVTKFELILWTSKVFLWTSHMFLTTLCLFQILLRHIQQQYAWNKWHTQTLFVPSHSSKISNNCVLQFCLTPLSSTDIFCQKSIIHMWSDCKVTLCQNFHESWILYYQCGFSFHEPDINWHHTPALDNNSSSALKKLLLTMAQRGCCTNTITGSWYKNQVECSWRVFEAQGCKVGGTRIVTNWNLLNGRNFFVNNANGNWKFEELAVKNTNWDLSNRNLPLSRSV
jgi:hypothetical protein